MFTFTKTDEATTELRPLTADEMDVVAGGFVYKSTHTSPGFVGTTTPQIAIAAAGFAIASNSAIVTSGTASQSAVAISPVAISP